MGLFGGIEAGGTKFVCAVGTGPDDLRAVESIATTTPDETIERVAAFFRRQPEQPAAIGIGSFGPVDLMRGVITSTPKPGWRNTPLASRIRDLLGVPVAFDTDVNAAALAEHRWGAARGLDTFIYLTVGTGIGGGAMVGGKLLHGLIHPEMGHIRIPHDLARDPYMGTCPFHGDCLEGLAAGPALERRWGVRGSDLPPEHPAWALEAHYLALGLSSLVCTLSPERIILGGGVMQNDWLFPRVARELQAVLNGYVQAPQVLDQIDQYVVPPLLGGRAGVLGCIALGEGAL